MKKAFLLWNPVSGSQYLHQSKDQLRVFLENQIFQKRVNLQIAETTLDSSGNIEIPEAWNDQDLLIVSGGDGTFSKIIAQQIKKKHRQLPVLFLPAGRGNDTVRSLYGFHGRSAHFLKEFRFASWEEDTVDALLINGSHICLNMVSFGFGGFVVQAMQEEKHFWTNWKSVYVLEGLRQFLKRSDREVSVRFAQQDHSFKVRCFNGFIGNGGYNGHKLGWMPGASMQDGLLNALLIPKPSLLAFDRALKSLRRGEAYPLDHKMIVSTKLSFHWDGESWPLEIDGEFMGMHTSIDAEVIPKAFKILKPRVGV